MSLSMLGSMASVFGVEHRAGVDSALVAIAIFPWDDSWCGSIIRKITGYDRIPLHIGDRVGRIILRHLLFVVDIQPINQATTLHDPT